MEKTPADGCSNISNIQKVHNWKFTYFRWRGFNLEIIRILGCVLCSFFQEFGVHWLYVISYLPRAGQRAVGLHNSQARPRRLAKAQRTCGTIINNAGNGPGRTINHHRLLLRAVKRFGGLCEIFKFMRVHWCTFFFHNIISNPRKIWLVMFKSIKSDARWYKVPISLLTIICLFRF